MSRLIALCGMDCTGKSTQAILVAGALRTRGASVARCWHRPGYSRTLDTARRLIRRASPRALPPPGPSPTRDAAFSRPWVRWSWLAVAVADTVLHYAVVVRWKRLTHDWVLCDRYVGDAIIDLSLRFPEVISADGVLARTLWAMAPRPTHSLFLSLPEEEQRIRAEAKCEPFPDPEDVSQARYLMYQQLVASCRVRVIDAARAEDAIFRDILDLLGVTQA